MSVEAVRFNGPKSKVISGPAALRAMVLAAATVMLPAPVASAAATAATQYWLGGTGNWSNPNLWSPTPGMWIDPVQESLFPHNTPDYDYAANLYGGGTATIQAGEAFTVTTFYLGANTALDGAGSLDVLGNFQWVGGNLMGSGSLTVQGDVDLTANQQNARSVYRPLTTYGTVNFTAGAAVYLNNAGDWHSHGTFNLGGASGISKSTGNATFHNHGTLNKTGTHAVRMESLTANHGTLNLLEGKLSFANNLTNNGTIAVAAGATLVFSTLGPATTHAAGSRITGAGAVDFAWGTHNLASYDVTGPVTFAGNTSVTFNNTISPSSLGDLYGTLTFNAPQSFPDVRIANATVGGAGDMEITGHLTWTNGSIAGSGTTTVAAGAVADLVGNNSVLGVQRNFVNNGTVNHNGVGLALNFGATITNNGTFNAVKGGLNRSAGTAAFNNTGTFRKSSTSTYVIGDNIAFVNAGSMAVDDGTLELFANFTNAGAITFAPGTKLKLTANTTTGQAGSSVAGDVPVQVAGGVHTFADAGAFALTGPLTITGGTLTLNGAYAPTGDLSFTGGNLVLNAPATLRNVTLASSLSGSGAVTVTGAALWNGGSVGTGGSLVFDASSVLTMSGGPSSTRSTNRNVETRGTTHWTGGSLYVSGSTWTNTGSFTAADGAASVSRTGAAGVLRNDGAFTKTGTSVLQLETLVSLDNRGTLNIDVGTLRLSGGGENTGTINVAAGATLALNASTFTGRAGSTLTGPGTVAFAGSATHTFEPGAFTPAGTVTWAYGTTVNINNPIAPAVLGPIDGVVNFNADQAFPAVTLSGTLGGTGTVHVTDTFAWSGGTIKSNVVLDSDVTLDIATAGTRTVSGTLRTGVLTRLSAGQITFGQNAKLINGGLFEFSGGQLNNSGTGSQLENLGTFAKVGAASLAIPTGLTVSNKGIVDVKAGTLSLNAPHADQVGTTFGGNGTWIVRDGATLNTYTASTSVIKTNQSTIVLEGPNAAFPQLNTLSDNQSHFEIRAGRKFTAAGNLANSGNLQVGAGSTLKVVGTLTNTGQVFVDGSLVLDYAGAAPSPADAVRQQLLLGVTTNGSSGIFSPAAAMDPWARRGLAYVEASRLLNLTGAATATWSGLTVDATSVLVLPAWLGDANLDGTVDADDYLLIDRALALSLPSPGWTNGDFDHSGTVDQADYALIDRVYVQQNNGIRLSPEFLAAREAQFGSDYVSALMAAVPEPTSLAACLLGLPVVAARRSRRR